MEFKIPDTTYTNPNIGTICHTLHKGTLNNYRSIVLGHFKCTKTNRKNKQNTATFSSPHPEPHKNMIQYMPIPHKTHL